MRRGRSNITPSNGRLSELCSPVDTDMTHDRQAAEHGFSGGAAFADCLDLDAPERYAEAAVMFGTLPFDAGVPVAAGRLSGVPTFAAQGEADYMIPRKLLDNTWACILADSGSPVIATRDPGDHQLSHQTVHESHRWLSQRAHFLRVRPESNGAHELAWVGLGGVELSERAGPRADASWTIPQQQTNQNAQIHLQERLCDEVSNLAGVSVSESRISVPGARTFTVDNPSGDADAFLVPQVHEFAHIHPGYDGSLHLALPESLAAEVSAKGWGRPHMWAGTRLSPGFMLVYGPRDEAELDVIRAIVATSHAYASASVTNKTVAAATH